MNSLVDYTSDVDLSSNAFIILRGADGNDCISK